jgi:hypothetical protein
MRLKRDRHSLAPARPRPSHNFGQHMRMRPVHAVEVAHAHQRRPKSRWNVLEFVENEHSSGQLSVVSGQ